MVAELEKVIRGLEHHKAGLYEECLKCPYHDDGCETTLCNDALALFEAQMPRVMTAEEAQRSTGNPMWFESRGKYLGEKGWWCLSLGVDPALHIRIVSSKAEHPITLSIYDYGRVWRCWSSRPTEEQRKGVEWNE